MPRPVLPLERALELVLDQLDIHVDADGDIENDTRDLTIQIIDGLALAGYVITPKADAASKT